MNDLWISASLDAEGEMRDALVSSARVACADNFAFVASASSSTEYEDRLALVSRDVESKIARLTVDSPEMFPFVHSAVLDSWQSDFRSLMSESAMKKGAPFAGYSDFDDCVRKNSGKDNPEAYCGSIKSKVEKSAATRSIRVGESFGPEGRYNVEEIDGDMALVYDNMNRKTFWRRVDSITPDFGPSRFNASRRKWASMPRFAENGPDQFGPDPSSQTGEAVSQLDDVDVDSAPENSNMGWIDEDNAYERRKDASRRTAANSGYKAFQPGPRDGGTVIEFYDNLLESNYAAMTGGSLKNFLQNAGETTDEAAWSLYEKVRDVTDDQMAELVGGVWYDLDYDEDSLGDLTWEEWNSRASKTSSRRRSSRRRTAAVGVVVRTFTTDEGSEVEVYYNGIRYCTGCGTKFIDYTDDEIATHSCDRDATGSWERLDWNEGDVPAWQRRSSRRIASRRRRVTSSENPFAKKNETKSETEEDTDSDEGMEEAPQEMEQTGPQMNGVDPSELSVGESVQVSYAMAEGGQGTVDCMFVREENGVFFFNGPTGEFGIADTGSGFQDADGNTFIIQSESADEKSAKTSSRRKTAMPSPAEMGVKVGDIFYNSWGYDQTNVDFYEVIRLTGAGVEVVPVYSQVVEGDAYNEYVVPVPGSRRDFDVILGQGKTSKVCRLNSGYQGEPTIVLSRDHSARLWDGRPRRQSGPYGGH